MNLVNDVHLVGAFAGGVCGFIPNVPDVVHTVVGGGINLHNVQNAAVFNAAADVALAAGVAAFLMGAVDRLGEDFGAGGFAGAAGAGKQICVPDAAGGHLILQSGDDGLLANNILKAGGPPFTIKRTVQNKRPPFGI